MQLFSHQQKFAKDYKGKTLVVHEGGSGKTICACVWLADGRDANALVVCPKKTKRKWEKALTDWKTKATILSDNEFKKHPVKKWSAKVIDEADEYASPLFTKGRSQRSEKLYELTRAYPDIPTLLLTATPIRSNPWNLHTLLTFNGHYIDWKKWRDYFFVLERRPFISRMAYFSRPDWRVKARKILEKHADIVLLKDIVELPLERHEKISIKTPKYLKALDAKPFFDEHRHEQQNKVKTILEIGKEFRKVLVVAYYREQIDALQKELSKDRETFIVYGGIKDQEKILEAAQKSDECFLIVQASLGAGFDADTFSCVVFASMSYSVRDFVQMKFRVRRVHNLHPVVYYYLFGGRCDKAVFENVEKGKEFIPSEWSKENVT